MVLLDVPAEYLERVRVHAYDLELDFEHIEHATFTGTCRCTLEIIGRPCSVFYLHTSKLDIFHASVEGVVTEISKDEAVSRATRFDIPNNSALVGSVVMELKYGGAISAKSPEGISLLSEQKTLGEKGDIGNSDQQQYGAFPHLSVLGTHLEPTHARDLFPCVDLPNSKATFQLTLHGIAEGLTTISNTKVLRTLTSISSARSSQFAVDRRSVGQQQRKTGGNEEHLAEYQGSIRSPLTRETKTTPQQQHGAEDVRDGEVKKSVTFHPTPVMSTYIFGFWVGAFHSISTVALSDVEADRELPWLCCGAPVPKVPHSATPVVINVHTLTNVDLDGARFALQFSRQAFALFSRLFAVPFPLSKLDIVGLPRMHGLGMENFGAITLLEDHMLVTKDTSFVRRRRIARLICHEVCHQWYGDIVTPQSFDELWLKEGLARFFEFVAVDALDPSYRVWTNFMSEVLFQAMMADSSERSHPVVQQHDGDINSILQSFDTITYCKGASVLRMLCYCVGPARFLEGTRRFVVDHQYACATQEDLWQAVQDVCDRDGVIINVQEVMQPWLTNERFPVLRVRTDASGRLIISQSPFSFYAIAGTDHDNDPQESAAASDNLKTSPETPSVSSAADTAPKEREPSDQVLSASRGKGRNEVVSGESAGMEDASDVRDEAPEGAQARKDQTWMIPLRVRVGSVSRSHTGEQTGKDADQERTSRTRETTYDFLMSTTSASLNICDMKPFEEGAILYAARRAAGHDDLRAHSTGADQANYHAGTQLPSRGPGRRGCDMENLYLVMNDDHSGFFTVQYECETSWRMALAALECGALSECEAMGFVHDLILGLYECVSKDGASIVEEVSGDGKRAIGEYTIVHRLYQRLSDVVQLLSRDRSHPAWWPGQLIVWDMLLISASKAIAQLETALHSCAASRGQLPSDKGTTGHDDPSQGTSRAVPHAAPVTVGGARDGTLRRSESNGAAYAAADGTGHVEARRVVDHVGGTSTPSVEEGSEQRCSSPNDGAIQDTGPVVVDSGGDVGIKHAEEESKDRLPDVAARSVAIQIAQMQLLGVTRAVENALDEANQHVNWHCQQILAGYEQASEPCELLVTRRDRIEHTFEMCRRTLDSHPMRGRQASGGSGNNRPPATKDKINENSALSRRQQSASQVT